jgi:hypothetical protein
MQTLAVFQPYCDVPKKEKPQTCNKSLTAKTELAFIKILEYDFCTRIREFEKSERCFQKNTMFDWTIWSTSTQILYSNFFFTINNDILMCMSPDQADRIFLVYRKLKLCDAVRSINYGLWYLTSLSTIF